MSNLDVACDTNTPVDELVKLSTDKDWIIRFCVAENPNTPVDILEKLSTDGNWRVKYGVSVNRKTPPHIRGAMSNDLKKSIRMHILSSIDE